jgi:hypothetical protein
MHAILYELGCERMLRTEIERLIERNSAPRWERPDSVLLVETRRRARAGKGGMADYQAARRPPSRRNSPNNAHRLEPPLTVETGKESCDTRAQKGARAGDAHSREETSAAVHRSGSSRDLECFSEDDATPHQGWSSASDPD